MYKYVKLPFTATGFKSTRKPVPVPSEAPAPKPVPRRATKKKEKVSEESEYFEIKSDEIRTLDDLISIPGIGTETLKDIKKIFPSLEVLRTTLKSTLHIPLRNDIVDKLRKELS
jgi:uncharacterized protein (UPF0147 family)